MIRMWLRRRFRYWCVHWVNLASNAVGVLTYSVYDLDPWCDSAHEWLVRREEEESRRFRGH